MKKLMVIMLFIGMFTQSVFAQYRYSALEALCERGVINGKRVASPWEGKVCLRAIHAVANDKSIRPDSRYLHDVLPIFQTSSPKYYAAV